MGNSNPLVSRPAGFLLQQKVRADGPRSTNLSEALQSMTVTADTLRELHRIHHQLRDLNDRLDRGPKQVAAREANVARVEEQAAQIKAAARQTQMSLDQKQLQLKSNDDKIADLKRKLNACSSNREYQALKDQIAADEMANSVLADEILEGMEKVDELKSTVAEADSNVARAKDELAKTKAAVAGQEESLRSELKRVQADLVTAEAALPVEIRDPYYRIVRSRGSDAMAEVQGEFCGGCFQQLTPNMFNELAMGRVVFCKSCGCMIYLPEDRTPGSGK